MDEVEGLTVYRERQKMAREIHDTVVHELTALIMKLEVSKYLSQTDTGKGMAMLEESIEDGRRALRSTRQVVETLTNSRRSAEDLNQLIARYAVEDGLQVHLEGQAMMAQLTTEQSHVIYRAVQEGMTNCLKHSNASDLWISLSEQNNAICLCIRDNGQAINGKQTVDEHFGIKGMRERVLELNGSFNYGTENGFEIYIEIPINREAGL
jgi:signal transduction histidine kinase